MEIKILLENDAISDEFLTEHGLSLYIETERRKILFDSGMTNKFIMNANVLDVNLRDVDMAILSHGHYDHGGGLLDFLDMNDEAPVYIHKEAFLAHGAIKEDISFEDDLVLFSHIDGKALLPKGNNGLLMKKGELWGKDDFQHEQNLLIKEGSNRVLVVGCSHRGIVNILKQAEEISDLPISHVIGGFHLNSLDLKDLKDMNFLKSVADKLLNSRAIFYTGHCTGNQEYGVLKEIMGDRIKQISTGETIVI